MLVWPAVSFATLFSSEADAGPMVIDKIEGLERKPLMVSRLRQAWAGVATASKEAQAAKRKGEDE